MNVSAHVETPNQYSGYVLRCDITCRLPCSHVSYGQKGMADLCYNVHTDIKVFWLHR